MTTLLTRPAEVLRDADVVGVVAPRISTQPLRELTPETSLGFEAIEFAETLLGMNLLPWQEWWLIHALELLPSGRFRFRTVLTLVARQNGKTHLLKVLALYFMYMNRARLVLGCAQSLDIARESWQGAVEFAQDDDDLHAEIDVIRRANGQEEMRLTSGARYRITAANRSAGRGLSVDLLILDELREQRDWDAWSALSKTTMARPNALTVGISNAGDDKSIVLNSLRASAIAGDDDTLAIFEWSAEKGCDIADPDAWAQANPGLGHTITINALKSALASDPPGVFRTEVLCQHVETLDGAVNVTVWKACVDREGTLSSVSDQVVACLDVAKDGLHATLCAAAVMPSGRIRVEVISAWESTSALRDELPQLLARMGPIAFSWFPTGPAAAIAASIRGIADSRELKGTEVNEVCMEFVDLVSGRQVLHPGDPLLDAHIVGASKLKSGDGFRFARSGGIGHIDAVYAAAGAIHTARTLPVKPKVPRSKIF